MCLRKYLNFTCISMALFSIILIGLTIGLMYMGYRILIDPKLIDGQILNLAGTFASLIIATISIITMIINRKYTIESLDQTKNTINENKSHNEKTLKQTNTIIENTRKYNERTFNQTQELIEQNERLTFIQLRFDDAKYGINTLMLFLQITLNVSNQLKELHNSSNPEKDNYLTDRGFLIMQFVNLTSNIDLLDKLPITLREEIEYKFDEEITNNKFIDNYILEYNLIMDNNPPKKVIQNYIEYNNYIHKFKNNTHKEQNKFWFRTYYGSKNINTQSFYNHFYEIYYELTNNSIEDLILKDKND